MIEKMRKTRWSLLLSITLGMYKYLIENESFGEVLSNSKNKRIRKLIKWLEMRTT